MDLMSESVWYEQCLHGCIALHESRCYSTAAYVHLMMSLMTCIFGKLPILESYHEPLASILILASLMSLRHTRTCTHVLVPRVQNIFKHDCEAT